jgi:hypothetical protein
MRFNPFYKWLGPEGQLQLQVCQYLALQYPEFVVIHPENEGRRTKFEQYKFKALGCKPGVSDLIIVRKPKDVLWLELKAGKNTPTPAQAEFLESMNEAGFSATWCNNFDAAKNIIDAWAKG